MSSRSKNLSGASPRLQYLVAPRDEGPYVLDTDVSNYALGVVLQQWQDNKLCVIAYGSRSLTPAERRYCITRKELLGVVYGLKRYRQHLLGRETTVRTDHAALQYLMRTPEPIGQQGCWLDLLSEFQPKIEHRAGKNHGNSDALSRRRPCERDDMEKCTQCHSCTEQSRRCADGEDCPDVEDYLELPPIAWCMDCPKEPPDHAWVETPAEISTSQPESGACLLYTSPSPRD